MSQAARAELKPNCSDIQKEQIRTMKTLDFAVAGYNLAETGRHIEIAGAFSTLMSPLKGRKMTLKLLFLGLSGKKG
jgi:hypothetical protein